MTELGGTPGASLARQILTNGTDNALLAAFQATRDQGATSPRLLLDMALWFFSPAFRRLGNVHDAEDAAQAVFFELARTPGRAQGIIGRLAPSGCRAYGADTGVFLPYPTLPP